MSPVAERGAELTAEKVAVVAILREKRWAERFPAMARGVSPIALAKARGVSPVAESLTAVVCPRIS